MLRHAVVRHPQALHPTPGHGYGQALHNTMRTSGRLAEIASTAIDVCKAHELGVQDHKRHLLADNPASG